MDAPDDSNLELYLKYFDKHHVRHVVRVCEPTYNTQPLLDLNIAVYDWVFPDGEGPPDSVITDWLALLAGLRANKESKSDAIAIHCSAGLGRAPVMVAIALIEQGIDWSDAVELIRKERRGTPCAAACPACPACCCRRRC